MLKTALKLGRSGGGALLTVAALSLSGCDSGLTGGGGGGDVIARGLRYSTWRERTFEKSLSPSVLKLAGRLDSSPEQSVADRPEGWAVLDLVNAPSLNLGPLSPEEAILINALVPGQHEIAAPVSPFRLAAKGEERERALECLTQAIYYEAALEPTDGQAAVAQVILNRMHHPSFPKSVCGVIYQGSSLATGCQFSFTCDGSMARKPSATYWQRAKAVAERALSGFVMKDIGTATHYHADYVFPRWAPTLVKIGQIGAHIFYRFPGPAGQPDNLRERYQGGELRVSMAGPSPETLAAYRSNGHFDPGTPTVTVIDPTAPGGFRTRRPGEMDASNRLPAHREIDRINDALRIVDKPAPKE